jgi:hypothetical protein
MIAKLTAVGSIVMKPNTGMNIVTIDNKTDNTMLIL